MRHLLLACSIFFISSCTSEPKERINKNESSKAEDVFKNKFLIELTEKIMLPKYELFKEKVSKINILAKDYLDLAKNKKPINNKIIELKSMWQETMFLWQQIELYQFGPAVKSEYVLGGEGLRDLIYSWPMSYSCRVDQEILSFDSQKMNYFEGKVTTISGLDALEHLVYSNPEKNTCPSPLEINDKGLWDKVSKADLLIKRGQYMVELIGYLESVTVKILNKWKEGDSAFINNFKNLGKGKSIYATSNIAMDDFYAGIFYLDKKTKDEKLGKVLGKLNGCSGTDCYKSREFNISNSSLKAIELNVKSLKEIFEGPFYNLKELLGDVKASDLANIIIGKINYSLKLFASIKKTMPELLKNNPTEIDKLYNSIKEITNLLKYDLVVTLKLKIPEEGESDSD